MNKTIWYGVRNDEPVFSENKASLTANGIDNPRSFTVTGEVNGLDLIGSQTAHQSQSAQPEG